ncbi:MAG TPA: AraC family transcriptional regulator [Roseiarcus sp.]|nr:AraC family transcriptional regulator [Roseiarcus sp.]
MSPPAVTTSECDFSLLGSGDFLARHPIFQARDLESVRHYLSGVLAPHRLTYWTRERGIDFRHQIAKIGAVDLNTIRFGGDVMVAAPDVPDFYLLHFMLAGNGTLTQGGRSFDQPAGSVTVINSNRSFAKKVSSASRQLLIRIERSLLERELQAWIGREPKQLIEFDQSQAFAITKVATLTHAVRMLCDDLGDDSSSLDHPLVRDRVASALVAALLVGLPHNHSRAFEGAQSPISPASVRRAEQFIEEHATKAIGLADIACAAGVSARALQMAFRRFRDTTPMAHLRALRLDMARNELIRARRDGGSVASVATAHGFGSLSRFAADYKARFHEQPSETLRYGGC